VDVPHYVNASVFQHFFKTLLSLLNFDRRKKEPELSFCFLFKAFSETLHTQREGTRFNYLKTVRGLIVPTDRGRTS
jgi:hypothetical protein